MSVSAAASLTLALILFLATGLFCWAIKTNGFELSEPSRELAIDCSGPWEEWEPCNKKCLPSPHLNLAAHSGGIGVVAALEFATGN